jgi:RNA polymerase sigma-70 factor (ECF subfamily)
MAGESVVIGRMLAWVAPATDADWDAVYREQLPRVYNYFRFRVGDGPEAEDLTSVTFEKAWRARHRYRRDLSAFTTWLLTIARNVAIDHYRQRRRHEPLEAAEEVAGGSTPEQDAERRSQIELLTRQLESLPDRERELLALRYGASLGYREIARLTGLTETNIGTILSRTVQSLRDGWPKGEWS